MKAYCNVRIYRLTRSRDKRVLNRELICKKHNLVLTSGLNQLRDACNGTAWQLSSIGLGDDGTAVTAADTWGLGPLVVAAPTTSYYKGSLFRASYLLEEDEQNGETIREVWISPDTTGPPGGEDAYARVVIDAIAKTSDYAYLFLFDCTFGGSCVATGWNMLAAQAASGGAYSFACDQARLGAGTKAESTADTVLELPWVMSPLAIGSTATADGSLTLNFTIPPDTYVGQTVREVALYFTQETGTLPLAQPWIYTRDLVATPYEVVPEEGATVRCVLTWESG